MASPKDPFVQITKSIITNSRLADEEFRLVAYLFLFVNVAKHGDHRCWPSEANIASALTWSERKVRRVLLSLERKAFVVRVPDYLDPDSGKFVRLIFLICSVDERESANQIKAQTAESAKKRAAISGRGPVKSAVLAA